MFLAIDIGNTNIVYALHTGKKWRDVIRVPTDRQYTVHALMAQIRWVLQQWNCDATALAHVGVASVVPMLDARLRHALATCELRSVHWVTHRSYQWPIVYPRPAEVGADRLADAAAAHAIKACDWLILDFGTATTIDYVDKQGGYHGGPIAPGATLTQHALTNAAAKLPEITLAAPKRMLPHSTKEAMQAGIFWNVIGGIEKTVALLWKEIGRKVPLLATGGLAPLIIPHLSMPVRIEPNLTLDGIRVCATT